MANIFNQNHSGSGNNVVNLGPQKAAMTPETMDQIASDLRAKGIIKIRVEANGSDESFAAADRLAAFLSKGGIEVLRDGDADTYMRAPGPPKPFTLYSKEVPPRILIDLTVMV